MTNRIKALFDRKREGILSVFYTAGFPALNSTVGIAENLEKAGVDLIEIGIPFSDPVADGPVIQQSNGVALLNGMTVSMLIEQVRELRGKVKLPVILMGYLNPLLQYGFEKFCRDAAAAGADGMIIPDMPLDVYDREYKSSVEACGMKIIFLVSPTTPEDRINRIDRASDGFIYAVSASSITGARGGFSEAQEVYFKRLRDMKMKNPFLIGFGISDHATFIGACKFGSGAIVGSAFISMLGEAADLESGTAKFIRGLRGTAQ